ncbi:MAG: SLBB domain-containing protein [Lentisphaeria bacterium]|nr:SLBB domain-containing protein [Lentisphaeria bacterium]
MMRASGIRMCGPVAAVAALFLCGCATTPFAPVAVPNNSKILQKMQGPKPDPVKILAELNSLQKVTASDYVLQPGDTFAIVVDGQLEQSRPEVQVMPNGAISVAPIGYVKVGGLSIPQATAFLQKQYQKYIRNCNVILEPRKLKPDTVTISGTVMAPGVYPFVFGSFRLMDAIAAAKGFQTSGGNNGDRYELADLENAYIVRNGKVLPVDFVEAVTKGNILHNIPLMNGDYIHIPSLEGGKVTILGEVDEPDCIPYQPNLTLLQAIAYVGGLKETNSRDVKVIRGGLKNPVVFTLDIRDLRYGRVMDFPLKPRDIVFVPRDAISEWNVLIRQILPSIQVLNGLAGPFGSPSSFIYR